MAYSQRALIRRPVITEKATMLRDGGIYTFKVDPAANKIQIRQAIEKIFEVHVDSVRTVNMPKKPKRQGWYRGSTSAWKKAYVKLRDGDAIDLVENL